MSASPVTDSPVPRASPKLLALMEVTVWLRASTFEGIPLIQAPHLCFWETLSSCKDLHVSQSQEGTGTGVCGVSLEEPGDWGMG